MRKILTAAVVMVAMVAGGQTAKPKDGTHDTTALTESLGVFRMSDPEAKFSAPSLVNGRQTYTIDVKPDWTCRIVSIDNMHDPNAFTIVCIKADAFKSK